MPSKYLIILLGISFSLLIQSCAPKLPPQAVSLMQQISNEVDRMHKLNLAYVNKTFSEKMEDVNLFIEKEYTPELIKNVQKQIAGVNIDMNKEWPAIVQKLSPQISATKDSLQKALVDNRIRIISKLNDDYNILKQACDAELNLLSSAVKLSETNRQVYNGLIQKISGNKLDAPKLEQALNGYLQKGSSVAGMILNLQENINTIL
jgi:hypothetical protein